MDNAAVGLILHSAGNKLLLVWCTVDSSVFPSAWINVACMVSIPFQRLEELAGGDHWD